jgi:hypothetical protein
MHVRNYEIPDGRGQGQPEVLVAGNVVDRLGMPEVDYDSLHQFMTDELGVPYDSVTTVKLFGRWKESGLLGFHVPYTRTIHVNAPASEYLFADTGGTMRVIAHEGRHRSDSTNRRMLTAAEIAGRWASYKFGYEVTEAIPYMAPLAVFGALKTRGLYYRHVAPEEKRARKQELLGSTIDHERDILFPGSMRTRILEARKLPSFYGYDDEIIEE